MVEGPGGGRTGGQGPSEPEAWGLTLRAEESHRQEELGRVAWLDLHLR